MMGFRFRKLNHIMSNLQKSLLCIVAYLIGILPGFAADRADRAPAAPTHLGARVISASQINLTWKYQAGNESGFEIERKTGSGGTWGQIGTVNANVTSYSDTGLTADSVYVYRVRANNAVGNSTYSNEALATTFRSDFDELRGFYLRDIHVLRDYRAGKNSFVEGPGRRLGYYTKPGQRLTLLDVDGPGSLQHIWATWTDDGNQRLQFYVDGKTQPVLTGTLDELIERARQMESPPAPVLGFRGSHSARSRNYYLPLLFQNHLRVEMEVMRNHFLTFYQLDYRTGKHSNEPERSTHAISTSAVQNSITIQPGGQDTLMTLEGPGILRRWQIQTDVPLTNHSQLDLEVFYDNAPTPAVRTNLADFFGPFRGVSMETDSAKGSRACYLPMPFAKAARFVLTNRTTQPVRVTLDGDLETCPQFDPSWGYFHALGQTTSPTLGFRQHQVLYARGRGHWLGMALYNTGHDHGGGDFAVLDGEGDSPAFLKGINGEDYFTFAWFGRGEHHPFAMAGTNEEGRYRHHFENPYPFQKSVSIYWGTYPGLATRSVAYWYQAEAGGTTVPDAENALNVDWDCFGPVPLKLDAAYRPQGDFWEVLPSVADLDAGRQFECRLVKETFTSGWMKQRSIGPMLDLTYLFRHYIREENESELGGMGHAWLARRVVSSPEARRVTFQLSRDDPVRVLVNGTEVYRGGTQNGFVTHRFPVALRQGDNEVVVQTSSFFNVTFNWAGFALRVID